MYLICKVRNFFGKKVCVDYFDEIIVYILYLECIKNLLNIGMFRFYKMFVKYFIEWFIFKVIFLKFLLILINLGLLNYFYY